MSRDFLNPDVSELDGGGVVLQEQRAFAGFFHDLVNFIHAGGFLSDFRTVNRPRLFKGYVVLNELTVKISGDSTGFNDFPGLVAARSGVFDVVNLPFTRRLARLNQRSVLVVHCAAVVLVRVFLVGRVENLHLVFAVNVNAAVADGVFRRAEFNVNFRVLENDGGMDVVGVVPGLGNDQTAVFDFPVLVGGFAVFIDELANVFAVKKNNGVFRHGFRRLEFFCRGNGGKKRCEDN